MEKLEAYIAEAKGIKESAPVLLAENPTLHFVQRNRVVWHNLSTHQNFHLNDIYAQYDQFFSSLPAEMRPFRLTNNELRRFIEDFFSQDRDFNMTYRFPDTYSFVLITKKTIYRRAVK